MEFLTPQIFSRIPRSQGESRLMVSLNFHFVKLPGIPWLKVPDNMTNPRTWKCMKNVLNIDQMKVRGKQIILILPLGISCRYLLSWLSKKAPKNNKVAKKSLRFNRSSQRRSITKYCWTIAAQKLLLKWTTIYSRCHTCTVMNSQLIRPRLIVYIFDADIRKSTIALDSLWCTRFAWLIKHHCMHHVSASNNHFYRILLSNEWLFQSKNESIIIFTEISVNDVLITWTFVLVKHEFSWVWIVLVN